MRQLLRRYFGKSARRKRRRGRHKPALSFRPRPLLLPEKKLAIFWSAKVGSTFAFKWVLFQQGRLEHAIAHENGLHRYYFRSPGYRKKLKDLPSSGYTLAKIVRSPFTRAVSAFNHAIRTSYLDTELTAFLGRTLEEKARFTFEEFVAFLEESGVSECNIHCRKQITPLEISGEIQIDRIIKLEQSIEAIRELENELGLPHSDLEALARSGHNSTYVDSSGYCGALAFPQNTSQYPRYKNYYTDELQARVAALFAEDFAAYGYDPSVL